MNEQDKFSKDPKFSLEVYDDHAIIRGWLTSDILVLLTRLCKKYGFKYLASCDGGFKLTK